MGILKYFVVFAFALLCTTVALAEEPAAPPEPTPEHKALEVWIGSWTGSGEMKPNPFGPAGPMSWSEECSWFGGAGFNVVCKSKGAGPTGPTQGLGIMGYNPAKKVYTHYGIDTTGWSGGSEGTLSDGEWTFTSQDEYEGKTYHTRFTMKWVSPTSMTFSWDMSEDGKTWTNLMEGTSEKK